MMRATVGPNVKNPPKIDLEKIVKLTGHNYDSLTNFEYEEHAMTGNENHLNMLKF